MLLYVECARRLVSNQEVHPQWIVLAVLCHLTLCACDQNSYLSDIFASSSSPFIGNNRQLRALPIIRRFCDFFQLEGEVEGNLFRWAQEILGSRCFVEP